MLKSFISILCLAVSTLAAGPAAEAAPVLAAKVLESRLHPSDCYTQGLFFFGGDLYESCGRYGHSSLNRWSFPAGRAGDLLRQLRLPDTVFAEGAAAAHGEIYVLSWREGLGFVLAPGSLMFLRDFSYSGEGWGLTWDGERLWRSDGSARLYPHRPGDFAPAGEALVVRDVEHGLEVEHLNELEWDEASGLILANIYGEDLVAAIDPADGRVSFWLDARPLRALLGPDLAGRATPMDSVLNGLALAGGELWLTGKLWPAMYRIAWPPAGLELIDK